MFLYHYFTSLIFAVMLFAIFMDGALTRFSAKTARVILAVFLFLVIAGFLFYVPLSYGIPLTSHEFFLRMFLPTWHM